MSLLIKSLLAIKNSFSAKLYSKEYSNYHCQIVFLIFTDQLL